MPAGQPTKYNPQKVADAIAYLADAVPENMHIPTVEGLALHLKVSRDTLYEWAKQHKEFSDTLDQLKLLQKEHLTMTGIFGGKEINSNIIMLLLKVNHKMIEMTHTDITSGGKTLPTPIIAIDVPKDDSNQEDPQTD